MTHLLLDMDHEVQLYGRCLSVRLPEVEKGCCEQEFRALKQCFFKQVVAQDLAIIDLRGPTRAGSQPPGGDDDDLNASGTAIAALEYAAYHHFRSKGWLPQPGLNFGADFVLYELHPEFAHSDYAVLVMTQVQQPVLAEGTACPASDNCTTLPPESARDVQLSAESLTNQRTFPWLS
eukprot:gene5115-5354_t